MESFELEEDCRIKAGAASGKRTNPCLLIHKHSVSSPVSEFSTSRQNSCVKDTLCVTQ